MNRRDFLGVSTLFLSIALSACATGGAPNPDLAQQFLTERNGGTPVAVGMGGPNAPIDGVIESIAGTRLTVKRPNEDATQTIQLADGVSIRKDVGASLSEIHAGDRVTAVGMKQDNTFQAKLLRLGDDADQGGGPIVMMNNPASDTAGSSAGGQDKLIIDGADGTPVQPVTGIVETIDGRNIVLKDKDGASTTVKLADDAKIQKSTEITAAELTAGTFILATGTRNGDIFQATRIQILPAPQQHSEAGAGS